MVPEVAAVVEGEEPPQFVSCVVTPRHPLPVSLLRTAFVCCGGHFKLDGHDPSVDVSPRAQLARDTPEVRRGVFGALSRLAENALAAYATDADDVSCDAGRAESARRVRDAERAACFALRAAAREVCGV